MNPTPCIIYLPEAPDFKPGRYLQYLRKGEWTLHECDGTLLRALDAMENRLVCAAHEPAAVNACLRFELGQYQARVLEMERACEKAKQSVNEARAWVETNCRRGFTLTDMILSFALGTMLLQVLHMI